MKFYLLPKLFRVSMYKSNPTGHWQVLLSLRQSELENSNYSGTGLVPRGSSVLVMKTFANVFFFLLLYFFFFFQIYRIKRSTCISGYLSIPLCSRCFSVLAKFPDESLNEWSNETKLPCKTIHQENCCVKRWIHGLCRKMALNALTASSASTACASVLYF